MNIENYINNFQNIEEKSYQKRSSISLKIANWIVKHPTVLKIILVSTMITALATAAIAPVSWPVLGFGAIAIAAVGGVVGLISALALKFLNILTVAITYGSGPHHAMKSHAFKPATYGVGKLYYQGDVPILELQADDPFKAGESHGFLLAPYINQIHSRLLFLFKLIKAPQASKLSNVLKEIRKTIPEDYIKEIEGVVEGYNKWGQSKFFKATKITVEDVLLLHLIPDQLHFTPLLHEKNLQKRASKQTQLQPLPTLGCTVVIDRDAEEGLVFARNMDWPSFGLFGRFSLITNRKYIEKNRLSTAEIGIPGFVGTLTGMNKAGLSLSMNVCSGITDEIKSMPAIFYNRMILEKCKSIDEVKQEIKEKAPLGPYHLTLSDANKAMAVHFFQGENRKHVIRKWKKEEPLVVTNCNYPEKNQYHGNMHYSLERHALIQRFFDGAQQQISKDQLKKGRLVEKILSFPYINNLETTHTVIMKPQNKKIKVAFDNSFAGYSALQELNTEAFF